MIIQNGWDQTARYSISSIQDNRLDVKFDHFSHQSPSERGPKDFKVSLPQYKVSKLIHNSGNPVSMVKPSSGIVDWDVYNEF